MELAGLCDLCGRAGNLYSCKLCGKRACAGCMTAREICKACSGGKSVRGGGTTF